MSGLAGDGSGLRNWSAGFAMVPNATAQDRRLPARARGVLVLLLSLPDDWKLHTDWLLEQFPDGREAVMGALRELRQHGYYRVERRRRVTDGTFTTGVSVSNASRADWIEQHRQAQADQKTERPRYDVVRNLLPDGRVEDQPERMPGQEQLPFTDSKQGAPIHQTTGSPILGDPNFGNPETGLPDVSTKTQTQTHKRTTSSRVSHLGNAGARARPASPATAELDPVPVGEEGPPAELGGPGHQAFEELRRRGLRRRGRESHPPAVASQLTAPAHP